MEFATNELKPDETVIRQNLAVTNAALSVLQTNVDKLEKRLAPIISKVFDGQTPYYKAPLSMFPGASPLSEEITEYNNRLNRTIDQIDGLLSRLQV